MRRKRIAVVLGTRPEIIKMSSLLRLLPGSGFDWDLIHTGQHYSYRMDRVFFRELRLPQPTHALALRSGGFHGEHVGRMMVAIEKIFLKKRPDALLVQGDTNSVLAGALAAAKIPSICIGHVEAGLRSYDRSMPEEINRIAADAVSRLFFAPTPAARQILLGEGVEKKNILVTGNTIVDAVRQCAPMALAAEKRSSKKRRPFLLLTLHRQENVDSKPRFQAILRGLSEIREKLRLPIMFPAHPRTLARLKSFGLALPAGVALEAPAGFLRFLALESQARLILTDSGGVQEEACILRVPCVTFRTTTERPETVEVGANVLAGLLPDQMSQAALTMMARPRTWKNPFGDGRAGKRILQCLKKRL